MNECDVCGKETEYNGLVYYSECEAWLCQSHYLKWCNTIKPYKKTKNHIKPCTTAWSNMCDELEHIFLSWLGEMRNSN